MGSNIYRGVPSAELKSPDLTATSKKMTARNTNKSSKEKNQQSGLDPKYVTANPKMQPSIKPLDITIENTRISPKAEAMTTVQNLTQPSIAEESLKVSTQKHSVDVQEAQSPKK